VAEQPVGQRKQPSAGRLAVAAPVDHRLKVAPQMRPADLSPPRHDQVIRAEPVAADDLTVFAPPESLGDLELRCAKSGMVLGRHETVQDPMKGATK
jgi:hypothetical protein